ncbi:GIP, partial [Symbiodinium sp. CCMP2456]
MEIPSPTLLNSTLLPGDCMKLKENVEDLKSRMMSLADENRRLKGQLGQRPAEPEMSRASTPPFSDAQSALLAQQQLIVQQMQQQQQLMQQLLTNQLQQKRGDSTPPAPEQSTVAPAKAQEPSFAERTRVSRYVVPAAAAGYVFLAKRNDEISLKDLSAKEKELFSQSDTLEWDSILRTKAVRVITGAEADRVRKEQGDRIISSRMVRRRKPLDKLGLWKAKSRWCLHGHSDPDTGSLVTYAPTPQVESIMTFPQVGANLRHRFSFCDVKNAFCQSDRLKRPKGPLYALPCEGLPLPPGALIEILVPVYGLDDAPAAWRATITRFLHQSGFVRNLIEPCWYMKYNKKGRNVTQVLVEVDDLIVSADEDVKGDIKKQLCERFVFGKWDEDSAEYAGRRIVCHADHISVDQSKYIQEQVHPVPLAKGRRKDGGALNTEEFNSLRSAIYRINWVAKETRPELCGLASIMASRLPHATVADILVVNKSINHLRNTCDRPLKIWRFDPEQMSFLAISDAGGINTKDEEVDSEGLPADATQGAWIVLAAESLPVGTERIKASPLAWRSSKLKRKVFSTFGGETQAMLQGINETDWLQIMYRDAIKHDVQLKDWRYSLSPHMVVMRSLCELNERQRQCSVTDAKSLFDCILKEHPQGRQDRKASLELAIIVRDLEQTRSMVRWVPHQKMVVDALTKMDPSKANGAMEAFLKAGFLSLVDEKEELNYRAQ